MKSKLFIPLLLSSFLPARAMEKPPPPKPAATPPVRQYLDFHAAHGVVVRVKWDNYSVEFTFSGENLSRSGQACFLALDAVPGEGSAVVPYGAKYEGSTTFLPFAAERVLWARRTEGNNLAIFERVWEKMKWQNRSPDQTGWFAMATPDGVAFHVQRDLIPHDTVRFTTWIKDLNANEGWGHIWGYLDVGATPGPGDRSLSRYAQLQFRRPLASHPTELISRVASAEKIRIYQTFPRLFGNTNETRKTNGSMAENGVGKFKDYSEVALRSLREMGITHLWLTGVIRHATATAHPSAGLSPDDPDLLKGLAGSPYAIKDYFDVCPDYADDPTNRAEEFRQLIQRCHAAGLRVLIDFVPNHVARSYQSTVKPEFNLGTKDKTDTFFSPSNHFFYLRPDSPGGGPPLRLPTYDFDLNQVKGETALVAGGADGLFEPEKLVGRVTGDNEVSWRPGEQSWYETVKLNYGFDFSQEQPVREFPHAGAPDKPVPDTWTRMDEVITWWQRQGVDGFRCDMAHMVPPEFWSWLIGRARERQPDVYFTAEAYNGDARKVRSADPVLAGLNHGEGHVKFDLLNAGFDSVYDDDTYWQLRKIYEGDAWANDLDRHTSHPWLVQNTLTYVENHDEVRVASKKGWGGHGMETGRAASGLLLGMSCGPVLIYNGQEVGEPAEGKEGFSGDDGRTTIFDYWSMPEWVKWVNGGTHDGGRLSQQQKDLRHFYASLLRLLNEPAFREGNYFPLNAANGDNPQFGRLGGEGASGHWLFAYIRADRITGQRFLVVVNLHPSETMYDVRIRIPGDVLNEAGFGGEAIFTERLSTSDERTIVSGLDELGGQGLPVGYIPPLTPFYFEATGQ